MNDGLLARAPVRRVIEALAQHGVHDRVVTVADTTRTAEEAARALGVPVGAIVKTLAFAADGDIALACISGDRRCDVAALAALLTGGRPLARAAPDAVKAATGFTIGGVAPLGHLAPLPLALDTDLGRFQAIFAAAGHPHCVFRTSLDELHAFTGGIVTAEIATASPVD